MATDYGSDVSTYPDLDRSSRAINGPRVAAERFARRCETEPALVADFGVPNDECIDLTLLVFADLTPADLLQLESRLEVIALAEDTVKSAEVTAEIVGDVLTVTVTGTLFESGPFRWVLTVAQGAALLLESVT